MRRHSLALLLILSACGDESGAHYPEPDDDAAILELADAGEAVVDTRAVVALPAVDAGQPLNAPDARAPVAVADAGRGDAGREVVQVRTAGSCASPGTVTGTLFEHRCVTAAELSAAGCILASEAIMGRVHLTASVAQLERARFTIMSTGAGRSTTHVCTGSPLVGVGSVCGNPLFVECTGPDMCTGPLYMLSPIPMHHVACG
jgi:hypothetical protein